MRNVYQPPVAGLLSLGEHRKKEWLDYRAMGLHEGHVPELVRMAADRELNFEVYENDIEVWAPLHAWRALGQLRAVSAAAPLLELVDETDENDDDWAMEEIPEVLGMIGPKTLPAIEKYLGKKHGIYGYATALEAVVKVAQRHPETGERCKRLLSARLKHYRKQDPELNGFLIADLCDLKAVEAMPLIERAYDEECVDENILGDIEDVKVEMGLIPPIPERERAGEAVRIEIENAMYAHAQAAAAERHSKQKARSKAKAARKARRKNR